MSARGEDWGSAAVESKIGQRRVPSGRNLCGGEAGKTNSSKGGRLDICDPSIATAPASAEPTGGLSETGGVLIGAAGMAAAILVPILTGGNNPSNSAP